MRVLEQKEITEKDRASIGDAVGSDPRRQILKFAPTNCLTRGNLVKWWSHLVAVV